MAAELIIAPEAEQDIANAYTWYENQRTGLGEEFLSCVDAPAFKPLRAHRECTPFITGVIVAV